MKKTLVPFLVSIAVIALHSADAATIARWTFETSIPGGATGLVGTAISGIVPEEGSGTGSGLHASAATTWSNPSGNGSVESLSGNNWAVGDYYQFQVSTIGFTGIGLSYDQVSSSTGPGNFGLFYSVDGSAFTQFGIDYTVLVNAAPNVWSSGTPVFTTSYSYDLSSLAGLDSQATVFFRLVDSSTTSASGGTVAAGGTDRVDNVHVFSPVPEPSTVALLGGFGALSLVLLRRRRSAP